MKPPEHNGNISYYIKHYNILYKYLVAKCWFLPTSWDSHFAWLELDDTKRLIGVHFAD